MCVCVSCSGNDNGMAAFSKIALVRESVIVKKTGNGKRKRKYENEETMTAMKNPGSRSIVVNRRKLLQTNCSLLFSIFYCHHIFSMTLLLIQVEVKEKRDEMKAEEKKR